VSNDLHTKERNKVKRLEEAAVDIKRNLHFGKGRCIVLLRVI